MKGLLILTVSCITLALCLGQCLNYPPQLVMEDGELVGPDGCMDPHDKSKHDFGSEWDSADCQHCSCNSKGEMECCSRYGGLADVKGCKKIADPETCTYKFYKVDDPSTPCPGF